MTFAAEKRTFFLPNAVWIALLLGIASGSTCLIIVGANLGLFFGGIVAATLLVPPLVLAEDKLIDRVFVAGAIGDGIGLIWLISLFDAPITLGQWFLCYIVLTAWCFALLGAAMLASRAFRVSILASAITVVLALLWLTWPIWLWKSQAPMLITTHPLMAINGVLLQLGSWSERSIAYRYLMRLGQDIPYELPRNIGPMVMIHLLIGAIGLVVGQRGRKG